MNSALRIRNKRPVQNGIVSTDTAMGALLVIILQPLAKDVIELSSTEADEVIQHFAFRTCDKAFREGIRFRRPRRYADTSYLMFWDIAAGVALIRAAGGWVEMQDSERVKWSKHVRCASNPQIWA